MSSLKKKNLPTLNPRLEHLNSIIGLGLYSHAVMFTNSNVFSSANVRLRSVTELRFRNPGIPFSGNTDVRAGSNKGVISTIYRKDKNQGNITVHNIIGGLLSSLFSRSFINYNLHSKQN